MALIKMYRDEPEVVGGNTEAMIPEEAVNLAMDNGWKIKAKVEDKKAETKIEVKVDVKKEEPKVELVKEVSKVEKVDEKKGKK